MELRRTAEHRNEFGIVARRDVPATPPTGAAMMQPRSGIGYVVETPT